jgi:integrase
MAIIIREYVVRIDHVPDCPKTKGCSKACVRVIDGWEADYKLRVPGSDLPLRKRERIPHEWSATKTSRNDWAEQREVYYLRQTLDELKKKSNIKVTELVEKFLAQRAAEGMSTERKDRQRMEGYILPNIGGLRVVDVRPRHAHDVVMALRRQPSARGGTLAPRTIRSAYFTLRQIFEFAVLQELIPTNPIRLGRGVLPKKTDKDPAWRKDAVFNSDETEMLISDHRVAIHRRVGYAIEFFTGLRPGQVSALTWSDYEPKMQPLGRLSSSRSYDSERGIVKATKTQVDHLVPVNPVLAKILAEWKLTGWKARHGRSPDPGDLIIPTINLTHRDSRKALEDFYEDLERLGLRKRRHYDSRRTFISLAMSAGAPKDLVLQITHPRPADVLDLYFTPTWEALCGVVKLLPMQLRGSPNNVVLLTK